MDLFCVHCQRVVSAEVVKGDVIYPHREDLYEKVFCRCPTCGNYVGCHKDGRLYARFTRIDFLSGKEYAQHDFVSDSRIATICVNSK